MGQAIDEKLGVQVRVAQRDACGQPLRSLSHGFAPARRQQGSGSGVHAARKGLARAGTWQDTPQLHPDFREKFARRAAKAKAAAEEIP